MRTAAALGFLLALTIGIYWQLTFSRQYTWLENSDQALQVRPWLDFPARELHAGRLPLWDPYHYGGQTLLGQVVPASANPFNWILFAMPLEDGHIGVLTLHWYWVLIHWVAAVFCYLLCRDLGAPMVPAILGASIFAFGGFMGHALTPQYLLSAVWLPIIFLFLARGWRGYRPIASAAGSGAAMGMALLSGHHNIPIYTVVMVGVLWLASRRVLAAAVFVAICGLVSAFQVLPAFEYGRQAVRWAGSPEPQRWNDHIPYAVHYEYSIGTGAIKGLAIPGPGFHAEPFVGMAALVLALGAVLTRWKEPMVRLFLGVAVFGLLIALGRDTPVQRLLYQFVPMVEKARFPAMAIVLCHLGIAVLASHWHKLALPLLVLCLVEMLCFGVRFQPRDGPGSFEERITAQSDIAGFLHRQPGWFRVQFDEDIVPYNFGDWHGIEQWGGFLASMPVKVFLVLGHEPTLHTYGIEYLVAKQPANPAQVEVFQSRSGLKVYRDTRVRDPIRAERPQPCATPDNFRMLERFTFEAEMGCPGLMVVGDSYYRGWRAYADGRRVPIQEVQSVRAVQLAEGRHTVEFRYRPASVYLGAGLSLLGLLATAVIARK